MASNGIFKRPPKEFVDLIRKSASDNRAEAFEGMAQLATALEEPLRQGVLVGDVVRDIYEAMPLEPDATAEFTLDLLSPGTEDEHIAYTNPGNGRIPERQVEGDFVQVPTYGITNAIDWPLKFARAGRFDVVQRAMQVLEAGFVKKLNDDGWHTILSAIADRNILVFDADATQGQFTKRLLSLLKVVMRRNAGGNTASVRRGQLTDAYLSPEAIEDVRNWGVDQIDEVTRREIFVAGDDDERLTRIFGVNLHDMDEFGEGQEYQDFFTSTLGASLEGSDVELVVGLDQESNDSFVMPIRQEVQIFDDPNLHRKQKGGLYGWMEPGFAVLDGRRVLGASF